MREAGDGHRSMGTDGQGWASGRNWREPRPWTRRGREGARGTCRGSLGAGGSGSGLVSRPVDAGVGTIQGVTGRH